MLIGLAGLPACGKTTIAKKLEKKGFKNLSRDHFISSMFNPVNFSSREQKDAAYKAMLVTAEDYLKKGENVVLDCPSFSQTWAVKMAQATAKKAKTKFKLIYLECSDDVAVKRIKSAKNHIATDRTTKLYFEVKKRFQPIKIKYKKINTDRPTKETMKEVVKYLKINYS